MITIKKAAVVVPPIQDFYFTYHRFSALGARIVHKILENFVPSPLFYNFPLLKNKPLSAEIPEKMLYLRKFINENEYSKISYFTKYKHFGPSISSCADEILNAEVNMCLISCFAFCYSHTAIELAKQLKSRNQDILIIAGGSGVSANPDFFLNSGVIDFVVSNEAEVSLPMLLKAIIYNSFALNSIPNIGWKDNNKNVFSETKAYTTSEDIEPVVTITEEKKNTIYLSTTVSRGCTFSCQFCSNRISQGSNFRTVNSDILKQEIAILAENLKDNKKQVFFNFEDDNILLDYEYLKKIIMFCKNQFKTISFSFENGIDYRLLTTEHCLELIQLGVRQFNFSIATTNHSISKSEHRIFDFSILDKLYEITRKNNVPVISYFICGFPDDNHESIIKNLLYLYKKPGIIGISLFYAVPGLMNSDLINANILHPYLFAGSSAFPWNKSLSTETLISAFRISRLVNLIKAADQTESDKELIRYIFEKKKLYTYVKDKNQVLKLAEVAYQDELFVNKFIESLLQI